MILHEIEYNALNLTLRFELVSFTLINQAAFQFVFQPPCPNRPFCRSRVAVAKIKTVTFLGGDLLEVRRNGHGLFLVLRINLSVFPR